MKPENHSVPFLDGAQLHLEADERGARRLRISLAPELARPPVGGTIQLQVGDEVVALAFDFIGVHLNRAVFEARRVLRQGGQDLPQPGVWPLLCGFIPANQGAAA